MGRQLELSTRIPIAERVSAADCLDRTGANPPSAGDNRSHPLLPPAP